jgi:hypothetical protein
MDALRITAGAFLRREERTAQEKKDKDGSKEEAAVEGGGSHDGRGKTERF